MRFSEKIAAAMQDKSISIRELSEKTGIPKSAVQRYISGETDKIPIDRVKLMAEALGIDPAYIMGWGSAGSHTSDTIRIPKTPEARSVSGWMDDLPEERRKFIESLVAAAISNFPKS